MLEILLAALLIFLLRVVGISLSTVRVLLTMRGRKMWSAVLGFFEVLVYVLALGQVVQNLSNVWNILAYCLGFSVGTVVGMWIEERLAIGYATVRVISVEHAPAVAEAIRGAGHGATEGLAHGSQGMVGTVKTVVRRKEVVPICQLIQKVDPQAFVTVEETQTVQRGYIRLARQERR
jgi:uncharacterized protein YebE (UPF0316 family)